MMMINLLIWIWANHIKPLELNQIILQNIVLIRHLMSESLEIEQLTKSLSYIVSTLNDLISKNNSTNLIQPENTRIKKTTDMTYH